MGVTSLFDPSVFENLKVVIEGTFYDLDLDGELEVIDRHDIVDLAYMSRTFEMTTRLDNSAKYAVECTLSLTSNLHAFSQEKISKSTPGCKVKIVFKYFETEHPLRNIHVLKQVWDKGYKYRVLKHTPIGFNREDSFVTIEITREKDIFEDDIDLLQEYTAEILHILQIEDK